MSRVVSGLSPVDVDSAIEEFLVEQTDGEIASLAYCYPPGRCPDWLVAHLIRRLENPKRRTSASNPYDDKCTRCDHALHHHGSSNPACRRSGCNCKEFSDDEMDDPLQGRSGQRWDD